MNQLGNNTRDLKVFDKDYEIIFSDTLNIYNNQLNLKNAGGIDFEFNFITKPDSKESSFDAKYVNKIFTINLYNFRNSLGIGTTKPYSLLKLNTGQEIYFSLHAKSLSETTDFIQVTLCLYKK